MTYYVINYTKYIRHIFLLRTEITYRIWIQNSNLKHFYIERAVLLQLEPLIGTVSEQKIRNISSIYILIACLILCIFETDWEKFDLIVDMRSKRGIIRLLGDRKYILNLLCCLNLQIFYIII